jgi:hypothetical protein
MSALSLKSLVSMPDKQRFEDVHKHPAAWKNSNEAQII